VFRVRPDVVVADAPPLQFLLDQDNRFRLHTLSVRGHSVQQVERIRPFDVAPH
jgi:hypothetical protein